MRSRSKLEIYLYLIQAVSKHTNPTAIGKEVNLSLSDTEGHLGFLAFQGFVRIVKRENSRVNYELSPKGFEALEALRKLTKNEQPRLKHTLSPRVKA